MWIGLKLLVFIPKYYLFPLLLQMEFSLLLYLPALTNVFSHFCFFKALLTFFFFISNNYLSPARPYAKHQRYLFHE